jgi:hypothetical protein
VNRAPIEPPATIEPQEPVTFACEGIATREARLYCSEHALAKKRGAFDVGNSYRAQRLCFDWKPWADVKPKEEGAEPTKAMTEEEFLVWSRGKPRPVFSGKKNKSSTKEWTVDESAYWDSVTYMCRRWEIDLGRVFSRDCVHEVDEEGARCISCDAVAKNSSFKRQIRKVCPHDGTR